jgi:hypothetical protein
MIIIVLSVNEEKKSYYNNTTITNQVPLLKNIGMEIK